MTTQSNSLKTIFDRCNGQIHFEKYIQVTKYARVRDLYRIRLVMFLFVAAAPMFPPLSPLSPEVSDKPEGTHRNSAVLGRFHLRLLVFQMPPKRQLFDAVS